jgi:hypothetical protein
MRAALPAALVTVLEQAPITRPCCAWAELIGFIQLSGGVRRVSDRVSAGRAPVGVVELPAVAAARMLRAGKTLAALTGETVLTSDVEPTREVGDPRDRAGRCAVVIGAVDQFTRRAGLVAPTGRRVIGLPTRVMQGGACDTGAVWRAALLTAGGLRSPRRRSPGAEVECPNIALALALAGLARRLGAPTQVQQHGDIEHVASPTPPGSVRS